MISMSHKYGYLKSNSRTILSIFVGWLTLCKAKQMCLSRNNANSVLILVCRLPPLVFGKFLPRSNTSIGKYLPRPIVEKVLLSLYSLFVLQTICLLIASVAGDICLSPLNLYSASMCFYFLEHNLRGLVHPKNYNSLCYIFLLLTLLKW